jgi:hypothetical protein
MSSKKKFVDVRVTSAFVVAGAIMKPGETLNDVPMSDAKALEKRGKVKLLGSSDDDGDSEYAAMTVPELKELAEAEGIEGFDKMKKAKLIAALEAAEEE